MIIKKIGVITGAPFGRYLEGKLLIISSNNHYYGLTEIGELTPQGHDSTNPDRGYRKATQSEINRHWENLNKHWDPQTGDKVEILQSGYQGSGVIDKPSTGPYYWRVTHVGGYTTPFKKNQMTLSRDHGWSTITVKEPDTKSDKFSKYHAEVVDELRKLDVGLVDLLNSRMQHDVLNIQTLEKVVGSGFSWKDSPEGSDFWIDLKNALAIKDYDKVNKLFFDSTKPKKLKQPGPRWKVGDYVTYKSHSHCKHGSYRYGGLCQAGFTGKITGYHEYIDGYNCFKLSVESSYNFSFDMLECEFEQWDDPAFNLKKPSSFKTDDRLSDTVWEEGESNLDEGLWELIKQRVVNDVQHCSTVADVLWIGFVWAEVEEGNDFWDKIYGCVTLKDYSKANQYYNDHIQQVKGVTNEPSLPDFGFSVGEIVQVVEPAMSTYKAKITYIGPLYTEIEVNLKDYPAKVKVDSDVIKKHIQPSYLCKLPSKTISNTEPMSEKVSSSDFKFNIGDYVLITDGVGKGNTGRIKQLPSEDPMYCVELGVDESWWKYPDYLELVSNYSEGSTVYPSSCEVLTIVPLKKDSKVSDYDQKPVTLYKPKTKQSLKPIKL